jgi:fucose permease
MESQAPRPVPVWIYLSAFIVLGSSLSIAGPALSHLRSRVGTNDGRISLVFVGSSIGYMIGSFLGGQGLDRDLGHRMWAGCMLVSVAAIGLISQLRDLGPLVGAFALLGVAGGASDVSGNTLVVWSRPDSPGAALNGLHLFYALGALSAPLLTNRAIAWSDSLWPIVLPLAVVAVVCGAALMSTPAPMKSRDTDRGRDGANAASIRRGQLAVVSVFFFVYVALEVGFAGWIHSYVVEIHYGDSNTATGVTVIFWVGFSFGRVCSIWLAGRFSAGWILVGSMTLAVGSSAVLVAVHGGNIGLWIVTFVFGVSVAPQFASMIGYAEAHLALSGAATSAFIAAAGLGGLVMPWSLGQLFAAHGPGVLPPVTFGACLATVAAGLWVRHIVRLGEVQRPPVTSMNAPVT